MRLHILQTTLLFDKYLVFTHCRLSLSNIEILSYLAVSVAFLIPPFSFSQFFVHTLAVRSSSDVNESTHQFPLHVTILCSIMHAPVITSLRRIES